MLDLFSDTNRDVRKARCAAFHWRARDLILIDHFYVNYIYGRISLVNTQLDPQDILLFSSFLTFCRVKLNCHHKSA